MKDETLVDKYRGALLGLAAGDAVGTTVEFSPRGSFPKVTDMVGGGPFELEPGQWTDDTSMALCLATSLVERGGFDARDQMNRYLDWSRSGYLSSNGRCFDIGMTVSESLSRYERTQDPYAGSTAENTAGNGCLMRLAPAVLFFFPDTGAVIHNARESSRTTHGATMCLDACALFANMLHLALQGEAKEQILFGTSNAPSVCADLASVANGAYRNKNEHDIRGSGFVVDSLEAALWCFWNNSSFEACVLNAANLGDDADTTAAICGQIAGAYYGETAIPPNWLERLTMCADIRKLADRLLAGTPPSSSHLGHSR